MALGWWIVAIIVVMNLDSCVSNEQTRQIIDLRKRVEKLEKGK